MTDLTKYVPRLSIAVSANLQKRMQDKIPWGIRSQLITTLLEEVLDMIDANGDIVIALIIRKKLKAKEILNMQEIDKGGSSDG